MSDVTIMEFLLNLCFGEFCTLHHINCVFYVTTIYRTLLDFIAFLRIFTLLTYSYQNFTEFVSSLYTYFDILAC